MGLHTPHTYESKPWSWLVLGRPVLFHYPTLPGVVVVAPFQLGRRGVVQDVDLAVTVENLFVQPQRPAVVRDHGIETAQTLPCVADPVPGRGLTAAVPGLLHHGRCVLADSDRLPVLAEPAGRWRSHRDTQGVSVDAIQQVEGATSVTSR